jgi:hypothetical protein
VEPGGPNDHEEGDVGPEVVPIRDRMVLCERCKICFEDAQYECLQYTERIQSRTYEPQIEEQLNS